VSQWTGQAGTYVCVVRKLLWIRRSRHTMAAASEMSVVAAADSQILRTRVRANHERASERAHEADTRFLFRSLYVGKRMMVNIVYTPPAAAVRTSSDKRSVSSLFRDLPGGAYQRQRPGEDRTATYRDQKRKARNDWTVAAHPVVVMTYRGNVQYWSASASWLPQFVTQYCQDDQGNACARERARLTR
jgi:hypothetical protein